MYNTYLEEAKRLIHEAGEMIRTGSNGEPLQYKEKATFNDLVTNIDQEVEKFLIKSLKYKFSDHLFLTEEYNPETKLTNPDYIWVIDPIDGTMNFVHGFAHYAVSIALLQGNEIILGLILDVKTNELYWAVKGQGAYLNDKPIKCSDYNRLNKSLLVTGYSSKQWKEKDNGIAILDRVLGNCHSLRITGSACLDLANIAAGRLDGFWHYGLAPWDVAAGIIMIQEAGGCCSDLKGNGNGFFAPCFVASNGKIHKPLIALLNK